MGDEVRRASVRKRLELIGLSKRFGAVVAVDDVDVTVDDGELVAVVGPSGCGKTTLLRIIAGLERPDRGRVFINGKDMTALPPERRDVGFVFQQFALFPNMTVAANVEYGLKRRRVARAERARRVEEMLDMVGLHDLAHRRPDQLSAGQQQRVALARALAPRPNTLLLDEPLSALDAAIRERLRAELRETQRWLGITTILVTHDQEEALAIADRVAVMNGGRLEQIGTPWELYDTPRTHFVAGFIGRGNFLTGRVIGDDVVFEGFGRVPKRALPDAVGLKPGPVTALVRPESVIVDRSGGTGVDNRYRAMTARAHIADVTFGGERSIVKLLIGDATGAGFSERDHPDYREHRERPGHPEQAAPELIAAVVSGEAHRLTRTIGERVTISVPFQAVRLLPPD